MPEPLMGTSCGAGPPPPTLEQLIHHVAEDKLVLWGWNPGDSRTTPPLIHAEFVRRVREWVDQGATCPE